MPRIKEEKYLPYNIMYLVQNNMYNLAILSAKQEIPMRHGPCQKIRAMSDAEGKYIYATIQVLKKDICNYPGAEERYMQLSRCLRKIHATIQVLRKRFMQLQVLNLRYMQLSRC
jgi:hypothetical protein